MVTPKTQDEWQCFRHQSIMLPLHLPLYNDLPYRSISFLKIWSRSRSAWLHDHHCNKLRPPINVYRKKAHPQSRWVVTSPSIQTQLFRSRACADTHTHTLTSRGKIFPVARRDSTTNDSLRTWWKIPTVFRINCWREVSRCCLRRRLQTVKLRLLKTHADVGDWNWNLRWRHLRHGAADANVAAAADAAGRRRRPVDNAELGQCWRGEASARNGAHAGVVEHQVRRRRRRMRTRHRGNLRWHAYKVNPANELEVGKLAADVHQHSTFAAYHYERSSQSYVSNQISGHNHSTPRRCNGFYFFLQKWGWLSWKLSRDCCRFTSQKQSEYLTDTQYTRHE